MGQGRFPMVRAPYGGERPRATAGRRVLLARLAGRTGKSRRMDSMEVNKGIAAVLVAGIAFFLTGLIGDNLVREELPEKPVLNIAAAPATSAAGAAAQAGGARRRSRRCWPRRTSRPASSSRTVSASPATPSTRAARPASARTCMAWSAGPHDHEEGFNYSPALEKFKGQPWTFDDAEPLAGQAERLCARHPHDVRRHPQ